MRLALIILGFASLLVCVSPLLAQSIPRVNPIIPPEKVAASFLYSGELNVQDVTNGNLQDLVFSAPDNSFYRVYITVANAGSILTPEVQAAFDAQVAEWNMVALSDGTKAYIAKNIPVMMMTSKDGRFDLKIGVLPPGENIDIIKNDKNKRMFENGAAAPSRANLIAAIAEIYNSVAVNYDQLIREKGARKSAIMDRLHPGHTPSVDNVPATSPSPAIRTPEVQPAVAPVDHREPRIPRWIYGVILVSIGLLAGAWFVSCSKK